MCSRVCVHGNLTPFEVRRGEQRERNKLLQRSRRRRGVSRGSGFRWGFFAVCLRSCLSDDDGDSANKPSKKRIQFIPCGKLHYQNTQCLFFFCDYNLRLIKYRSSLIVHWTETTELIYSLNVGTRTFLQTTDLDFILWRHCAYFLVRLRYKKHLSGFGIDDVLVLNTWFSCHKHWADVLTSHVIVHSRETFPMFPWKCRVASGHKRCNVNLMWHVRTNTYRVLVCRNVSRQHFILATALVWWPSDDVRG